MPGDSPVNLAQQLFSTGQMGAMGGMPQGADNGRPFFLLPSLTMTPFLDFRYSPFAFLNNPMMPVNFNASNPNGWLGRLLRALQLDGLGKQASARLLQGASREQHQYEGLRDTGAGPVRPLDTPGSSSGSGPQLG